MSLFTIFAILFTIANVLYYATMITRDVTAKPNKGEEQSVNISVGEDGAQHNEEDFTPKTVKENSTGGFDFVNPIPKVEEAPIEEAEESKQDIKEEKEELSSTDTPPTEPSVPKPGNKEQDTTPSESTPEEASSAKEQETSEGEQSEEIQEEEETENSNITIVDFSKAPKSEEKASKPFDESEFFDQDKLQPQYGVSQVIEPKPDPAVQKRTDNILSKLEPTSIKEKMMSQQALVENIKNNPETNIEHQNVYANV